MTITTPRAPTSAARLARRSPTTSPSSAVSWPWPPTPDIPSVETGENPFYGTLHGTDAAEITARWNGLADGALAILIPLARKVKVVTVRVT